MLEPKPMTMCPVALLEQTISKVFFKTDKFKNWDQEKNMFHSGQCISTWLILGEVVW